MKSVRETAKKVLKQEIKIVHAEKQENENNKKREEVFLSPGQDLTWLVT